MSRVVNRKLKAELGRVVTYRDRLEMNRNKELEERLGVTIYDGLSEDQLDLMYAEEGARRNRYWKVGCKPGFWNRVCHTRYAGYLSRKGVC